MLTGQHLLLNRVEFRSLAPPVTVGTGAVAVSVADVEDGMGELSAPEVAELSAEEAKEAEAASSVVDEGAVVAGESVISSCRGRGCATPAKAM